MGGGAAIAPIMAVFAMSISATRRPARDISLAENGTRVLPITAAGTTSTPGATITAWRCADTHLFLLCSAGTRSGSQLFLLLMTSSRRFWVCGSVRFRLAGRRHQVVAILLRRRFAQLRQLSAYGIEIRRIHERVHDRAGGVLVCPIHEARELLLTSGRLHGPLGEVRAFEKVEFAGSEIEVTRVFKGRGARCNRAGQNQPHARLTPHRHPSLRVCHGRIAKLWPKTLCNESCQPARDLPTAAKARSSLFTLAKAHADALPL